MATVLSRVETIFFAAIDKCDTHERMAYLDAACGDDQDLRERVERLLHAQSRQDASPQEHVNDPEATQIATIAERPGTVIGRYKLLQQIGEGGFGVVFMAEQLEPVQRKVALKIIKPGMDTKEVVARFEAERQALALMDHPNIARVLDAGATESGRPFFVMELVRGVPITSYCDQHNLTPHARLDLFMSVCHAVQHAHQKGIIHRDVKPSNVLVTLHDGTPVVKVIDFGVAKAIGRRLTERTLFTRYAELIGTPLYMSPEQAEISGLDIDTRSDIYSLGVLLYELLTGATPIDKERFRQAAFDEVRRIIREEEPPRPSLRVSTMGEISPDIAEHRNTDLRRLSTILRGDLDWIVMKALEKDRTRRYATAKDFADDVHHYLTHQPVEARAPSTVYRVRKFVRRYRAVTATIAVIAATLIVATVISISMAVRADRALRGMEEAVADTKIERQYADDQARKSQQAATDAESSLALLAGALGFADDTTGGDQNQTIVESLRRLSARLDANETLNWRVTSRVRAVIAKTYLQAGKIQDAESQLQLASQALPQKPQSIDAKTIAELFDLWMGLGSQFADEGKLSLAKSAFMQALTFSDLQESNRLQRRHEATLNLSNMLLRLRDWEGAESIHRDYLAIADGKTDPNDLRVVEHRAMLACTLIAQKHQTLDVAHQQDDASASFDVRSRFWMQLAQGLRTAGRMCDAKQAYTHALQMAESQPVPNKEVQRQIAVSLSDVLFDLRDHAAVEATTHQAIQLTEGQPTDNPNDVLAVVFLHYLCAFSLDEQGRSEAAQKEWAACWRIVDNVKREGRKVFEGGSGEALLQADLLSVIHDDEATLQRVSQLLQETAPESTNLARFWWHQICAEVQQRLRKNDEALRHARIAAQYVQVDDSPNRRRISDTRLVRLYRDAGNLAAAEAVLRQSLADYHVSYGHQNVLTLYVCSDLGELLLEQEKYSEAEPLLNAAQSGLLPESEVPATEKQRAIRLLVKACEGTGKFEQARQWQEKLDSLRTTGPNELVTSQTGA